MKIDRTQAVMAGFTACIYNISHLPHVLANKLLAYIAGKRAADKIKFAYELWTHLVYDAHLVLIERAP